MASDQQPRRELRPTGRIYSLEQFPAVCCTDQTVSQVVHVDVDPVRHLSSDGITGEDLGAADCLANAGETPTQRPQRIGSFWKELRAQFPAGERPIGQEHSGQHRPRFLATQLAQFAVRAFDTWGADQADVEHLVQACHTSRRSMLVPRPNTQVDHGAVCESVCGDNHVDRPRRTQVHTVSDDRCARRR